MATIYNDITYTPSSINNIIKKKNYLKNDRKKVGLFCISVYCVHKFLTFDL